MLLPIYKSAALLGLAVGLGFAVPKANSLDSLLAAAICIACFLFPVNAYYYILHRTEKSLTYKGIIAKILGFRTGIFLLIATFTILCSLAFIIHIPSLSLYDFLFLFLSIPFFAFIYFCCRKILEHSSVDWLITGRSLFWTVCLTPLILVLLYGVFICYSGIVPVYATLGDAIHAQPEPWNNTSSPLITTFANWSRLGNACRDFGLGQLFKADQTVAALLVAAGYYALFYNICTLLAFAYIPRREYKRLLLPLTDSSDLPDHCPKPFASAAGLLIVLTLYFTAFHWLERKIDIVPPPPEKPLIQIGNILVGKDTATLLAELQTKLRSEMMNEITGPIGKMDVYKNLYAQYQKEGKELLHSLEQLKQNTYIGLQDFHEKEMFPQIERNVDLYLDWYYSITGEYVRIGNLAAGNFEQHMKVKLNEYLTKNVNTKKADLILKRLKDDSSALIGRFEQLNKLSAQLFAESSALSGEVKNIQEKYAAAWKYESEMLIESNKERLVQESAFVVVARYESPDDFLAAVPDVSLELNSTLDNIKVYTTAMQELLSVFTQHKESYFSFNNRLAVSSTLGIAGLGRGMLAGSRIASRVAGQKVFREAAEIVVKQLIKRTTGVGGGTGVGAAAGASVGSAVPVVGTAAGAVVGGIIGGVGSWFAADYVLIKLEEHISRQKFKREILYGIDKQRNETMTALQNIFQNKPKKNSNEIEQKP